MKDENHDGAFSTWKGFLSIKCIGSGSNPEL